MMGFLLPLSFVLLSATVALLKPWKLGSRERDLPPGPPTTAVIGNALQFPRFFPHFTFTEWSRRYGDVFSLKILNQTIVVLSSPAAVQAILDKQGLVTGNRPKSHIINRTEGIYTVLQDMDNPTWRASRKLAHAFLTPEKLASHLTTQRAEWAQFLNDLLDSPQDIYTHIRRTSVSIMTTLIYGRRCPVYSNSHAERYFKSVTMLNELTDPFAHPPVDLLPILKYVPAGWAKWKGLSDHTRQFRNALFTELLEECEERVQNGEGLTGCYMESVLQDPFGLGLTRDEIKAMGKVILDGGTETGASFLQSFVLALINFPEMQRRAHEEIDQIIPRDRLPTLEDFENLPFLKAFVKEVHRFRPVFPLGLPHVPSEDVTYKEYRIPKGSIILTNIWGMLRDPELFEDPETFNPERYMDARYGTKADGQFNLDGFRDNLHFGSGRRICPGEAMATRTMAINTMNLLWAFTFAKDQTSGTGNIELHFYECGSELSPKLFTCKITARDKEREELIREWYAATSASNVG